MTVAGHTIEHAPTGGGLDITFNPLVLVVLAVAGYVAYRAFDARRRGQPVGRAAGRALAESAPPAIAAVVGVALLWLAVSMLFMLLFVGLLVFVFTAPFAVFASVFTGDEPEYTFGPLGGLPGEVYFMLFLGMLLVVGAVAWTAVAALRRTRPAVAARPAPPAAEAPAPARRRGRPLRAPGR